MGLLGKLGDVDSRQDAVGIAADEFLAADIRFPSDLAATAGNSEPGVLTRRAALQRSLVEGLQAEPGVLSVAVANVLPRMEHRTDGVEVDGAEDGTKGGAEAALIPGGNLVRTATVDVTFFRALGQRILVGREFTEADLTGPRSTVIVNTAFVDRILAGENPIGRRFRYEVPEGRQPGPWFEVVGVVGHLGMHVFDPEEDAGVYHPAAPGEIQPLRLGIHVAGEPETFIPRLTAIAREVDPSGSDRSPR